MSVFSLCRRLLGLGLSADDIWMGRYMEVRRLATQLWVQEGGHVPRNGTAIHAFMVTYPPTRIEYEARAKAKLGYSGA